MSLTRLFREYALSGEIPNMFLGGNTPDDVVLTKKDLLRAKGEMSTQFGYDVALTTGVETKIEFDASVIARNGIATDVINSSMAVTKAGLYEVYYGLDVGCDNNEEISFEIAINGGHIPETTIHLEGRGRTKPVPASWKKSILLNAGDVITMQVISLSTNMTASVEKSILIVKEDR